MIDIARLLQPDDSAAASLPHHARILTALCGEYLTQVGPGRGAHEHLGHLLVLSRKDGHERLSSRYAALKRPGTSGKAEPLANLLNSVGNRYEAGSGPLRREPGEAYVGMVIIVRGIEGHIPAVPWMNGGELLARVRTGELSVVTRGLGLSADDHRAYTWITQATTTVQGWLLEPGEPWPESSPHVPAAICLHERLSAD